MILPPKNIFSKHQNKAEFKNLDDFEVPSSDFSGLRTSATSMTSTALFLCTNQAIASYILTNLLRFI
jgi:hypothetical protein